MTVSVNPTKFKACTYLHWFLIKKRHHLNNCAWGSQIGSSTTTKRGRSPARRFYCYGRVSFLFRNSQRHVLEPIIYLRKAILKLKRQQYWNLIMCRVSFITGTFLKSLSTISASNTGCPSMKMYLLVWEIRQWNGTAWDTCFSEMGMERIKSCSNHNISEEESARSFQTSTSLNAVLPI